jgi:ABC-type phosphate transport system, periplasmic component
VNITRPGGLAVLALAGALTLASCAANEGGTGTPTDSTLEGTLSGVGASSQGSAQEGLIAAFQTANPGVTINYSPDGSGAGREAFLGGGADFAGSDRAFTPDELAGSEFAACAPDSGVVEVPLYISPIAVVFNLDGVSELNLDAATIADIFDGGIATWDDPAIAALNEGVTLPSATINPVHRADDSGTQENFTAYLAEAAGGAWEFEADGEWPAELGGEGASGTSGVVSAVEAGSGSIGFIDASRVTDRMGVVSVAVGDAFVAPSAEGAAAAVDASPLESGREPFDLAVELERTTDAAGAYPIALVSYLVACEVYTDPAKAELVKAYLSFVASEEGQRVSAGSAGSAPISATLREQVEAALEAISS